MPKFRDSSHHPSNKSCLNSLGLRPLALYGRHLMTAHVQRHWLRFHIVHKLLTLTNMTLSKAKSCTLLGFVFLWGCNTWTILNKNGEGHCSNLMTWSWTWSCHLKHISCCQWNSDQNDLYFGALAKSRPSPYIEHSKAHFLLARTHVKR